MKKTSKVFGTIALSAALAFGTMVPAFAADGEATAPTSANSFNADGVTDDTDGTPKDSEGKPTARSGSVQSHVYLTSNIPNINVTVPLYVNVNAPVVGGAVTGPTAGVKNLIDGAYTGSITLDASKLTEDDKDKGFKPGDFNAGAKGYRMENYSQVPVTVTALQVTNIDEKWSLTDAVTSGSGAADAPINKVGALGLTLVPVKGSAVTTTYNGTTSLTTNLSEGTMNENPLTLSIGNDDSETAYAAATTKLWKMYPRTAEGVPSVMGLSLTGSSSKLDIGKNGVGDSTANDGKYFAKVFDIVFTVSA
ncbi:hypothetical protein [Adlercreutzia sp. ZJ304]|uniref:hypothetical protein n=1 Tax=Adlercreutzia sp. ZJ304 TaxID=2709791 RepID=UPI0013EB8C23|nr:hypothetical protein [Adlercreutzia sp. ZJ304]